MFARGRTRPLPGWTAPIALLCAISVVVLISFAWTPGRHGTGSAPAAAAPAPATVAPTPAGPVRPVYLTFDDGPDPKYTPQVLDILRRHGAKATFFEVGLKVKDHPALTRRIQAEGHSVQNHTWTHADLTALSWPRFSRQVAATDQVIRAETGVGPRCLRPPYGAVDKLVRTRSAGLGKKLTLWDVDSHDWKKPGTQVIVQRVLAGVRPGSVVLLHDGGGDRRQTIAALPTILETLQARGFTFQPLPCD